MKSFIYIFLFSVKFLHANERFHISGTIEGIDNQLVYLTNPRMGLSDSVVAKNGTFVFDGEMDIPDVFFIRVKDLSGRIQLFVEKGDVEVRAIYDGNEKRLKNIVVKGSEEHEIFQKMNNAERGNITPAEMNKMLEWQKNNDTVSIQKLKMTKQEEKMEAFKTIQAIAKQYSSNYAPAFWIGSARIDGLAPVIVEQFYSIYQILNETVQQSYYAKKFIQNYEKIKQQ